MTISTILKKAQKQAIGRQAVIVLPLDVWEDIEDKLEDYEIMHSKYLKSDIAESRRQIKNKKIVAFKDL